MERCPATSAEWHWTGDVKTMVWIAILWSIVAILWLAWNNAKRRRVFGFDPLPNPQPAWIGWLICVLPGPFLLIFGTNADIVNWLGAACAFGWMVVAVTPASARRFVEWLDHTGKRFETYMQERMK